jgi:hypothetical protein
VGLSGGLGYIDEGSTSGRSGGGKFSGSIGGSIGGSSNSVGWSCGLGVGLRDEGMVASFGIKGGAVAP